MAEILRAVLDRFDITQLAKQCNMRGCVKNVTRDVTVLEYKKMRNQEIAKLFLCDDHAKETRAFMKILKDIAPNKILQHTIEPMGRPLGR